MRRDHGSAAVSDDRIAELACAPVNLSTPAVLADPGLTHQVVLRFSGQAIVVSCNCRKHRHTGRPGNAYYEPLAMRARWGDGEAVAVWRAHAEEVTGHADGDGHAEG
jgi:hypothetical protein